MSKNILSIRGIVLGSLTTALLACNSGGNSSGGGAGTSVGGNVKSAAAVQIPANYGNRGIKADLDLRLQAASNNSFFLTATSESNSLIVGYNPLINSASEYQCFNYTTTTDEISVHSKVNQASLSKTLSDHLSLDFSAKGSVSTYLSGNAALAYSGDASSGSFSQAATYIYQVKYPLKFSQFSLNSVGQSQASAAQFGLNCGSNVLTSADGNVTVFIEILANSSNENDSYNFNQALGANIDGFANLAESVGYANSQSSSAANVKVSAMVIGGNGGAAQIINAVQESTGQQCLKTGNSSACAQWNQDVSAAIQAEQNSVESEVSAGNFSSLHLDLNSATHKTVTAEVPIESVIDPFGNSAEGLKQLAKVLRVVNYINAKTKALKDQLAANPEYQISGNYAMLNGILAPAYSKLAANLNDAFSNCLENGIDCHLDTESISGLLTKYSNQTAKNLPYLISNFYALQTVGTYNLQPNRQILTSLPSGSYTQSCQNRRIEKDNANGFNTLKASCWTEASGALWWYVPARLNDTSLDYINECLSGSSVSNIEGELKCDLYNDSSSRPHMAASKVNVNPIVVENVDGASPAPALLVFNANPFYDNNIAATNNNGVGFLFNNVSGLAGIHLNSDIIGQWYSKAINQSGSPFYAPYKMFNHSLACNMETNAGCSVMLTVGANCVTDGYTANGYYCSTQNPDKIFQQNSEVHIEYNSLFAPLVDNKL